MTGRRKTRATDSAIERDMREQELLRAKRELAAYFTGRRTEREARAALKTIKAFIRARERQDPTSRPPLPGMPEPKRQTSARKAEPKRRRPRTVPATRPAPDAAPPTKEPTGG